jgi:hypothetical protein
MSQAPVMPGGADLEDRMLIDPAPTGNVTEDSTPRDLDKFRREVNGRLYNAQNTTYFLPAGESQLSDQFLRPPGCGHPPLYTQNRLLSTYERIPFPYYHSPPLPLCR